MHTTIFFSAFMADDIHGTAHALLKYLDIYNLKPPKDHGVVIHTSSPAALEAYASFFDRFELHQGDAASFTDPAQFLRKAGAYYEGHLIYFAPHAYPVRPLEPLLHSLERGQVFGRKTAQKPARPAADYSVLAFDSSVRAFASERIASVVPGSDAIEVFENLAEFRVLLRRFFSKFQEESVPNQVKLMHPIDARGIEQQKQRFQQLPFFTRWARKVLGTGWAIEQYTKKF